MDNYAGRLSSGPLFFGASMEYRLYLHNERQVVIAHRDCADDFIAENWARDWVTKNAASDNYLLEREDGGFSAKLLHTVGGQWYTMRT
jgi:hypothetical protein